MQSESADFTPCGCGEFGFKICHKPMDESCIAVHSALELGDSRHETFHMVV